MGLLGREERYDVTAIVDGERETHRVQADSPEDAVRDIAERYNDQRPGFTDGTVLVETQAQDTVYSFSIGYALPGGSHSSGKKRSITEREERYWQDALEDWERSQLLEV
ncbi:MAG: hypothetical protein SVU32_08610 [Candidatus Nanohaloarchaea archaeon]|nr:hypothetical protein [Candidatus Nanohaloarchaea archaeon]